MLLTSTTLFGQELAQMVRGSVVESVTGNPLAGVSLELLAGEKSVAGTATDANGVFSLTVDPGRYLLKLSHVGYQSRIEELLVISGKETRLRFELIESVKELNEVQVVASSYNPAPGATDISIEKTLRVPANFFDPLRMASSMPGTVTVNDQGNSLAIRGYSPNAMLWKLEGLDIVNPNHLANAGTLSDKPVSFGGGVSILSSQVLDKTGFYSGWMPARFGNALSGVVDMSLRDGNKSKSEYTAQASLIGLDLAAEGPLTKKGKGSYLVNYRYSTVGLLSQLGVNFGNEKINFQDITFHVDVEQSSNSKLSVFGFGGLSSNRFKRKPASEWEEEKDRYDIDFEGKTFGIGLKETWGKKVKWTLGSVFSGQQQERHSQSAQVSYPHVYTERYKNDYFLSSTTLNGKMKKGGSTLEWGLLANYLSNKLDVKTISPILPDLFANNMIYPNVLGRVSGLLLQPYLGTSSRIGAWQIETGLRYTHFGYNDATSLDPRLSAQRTIGTGSLSLSYNHVSQWQQTQTYLGGVNNQFLGLSKAHQYLVEFRQPLGEQSRLRVATYYHQLYDIPVSALVASYSVVNQWEEFGPQDLKNDGTAENLGAEASYEKTFDNRFYLSVNGAVYKATYKGGDGKTYQSRFNGGYTTSALVGKEWGTANKSFGVHMRVLYLGGMRQQPIDLFNSVIFGTTVYDGTGYSVQLPTYWRPDLRVSWRKNKPGYTRTLSIDIQNVANRENVAYNYFDTFNQDVQVKRQLGLIPVVIYRVDF